MKVDYEKIFNIHGIDIINQIKDNIEDITYNMNYLSLLQFNDATDIFERYPQVFICSKKEFQDKINKFIKQLGINYVELLENDMGLWEELL